MKCQVCENENLIKVLSLGHQPPSDKFLSKEELIKPETHYPLDLFFCEKCKLVQTGYAVDPKILFTDSFVYLTGENKNLKDNFHALVKEAIPRFNLSSKDFVIDIGSNDGTLLEAYLPDKIKILGVDPSEAAKIAVKKGIPTLPEFFNEETAKKILKENGKAKIITATNVFAHVRELDSLMKGIKLLLTNDGVFIEESHYLLDLIHEMEYDSIYAEHLRYYSLKPLIYLFNKYGLDVFDVKRVDTHGGSLRVYACKKNAYKIIENVSKTLMEEEKAGLYTKETFTKFGQKVVENRQKLLDIVNDLKSKGKKIVGIGAPAKGNTLLNFCKIGPFILDYLCERNELKIGKYSPGMHIKVIDEKQLFEDQPEYALLLAWNIKHIIIPKLKEKGFKGKFIIPIPFPEIV